MNKMNDREIFLFDGDNCGDGGDDGGGTLFQYIHLMFKCN